MPTFIRIICGILSVICFIGSFAGPFAPGPFFLYLLLGVLFLKLAKIPFFTRWISKLAVPLLLQIRKYTKNYRWGLNIRVKIAKLLRWFRSFKKFKSDKNF